MPDAIRKGRRADPQKGEAIIEAARSIFAERGYGASVDDIAAAAGVSKQTIYSRYAGKHDLLAAVVSQTAEELVSVLEPAPIGENIEAALSRFAEKLVEIVYDPQRIAMQRLLIAESAQFPDLAKQYYAVGPAFVRERLSKYLAKEAEANDLLIDNSAEAASLFVGLVIGADQSAALMGLVSAPDEKEKRRRVHRAVDAFLKIYSA